MDLLKSPVYIIGYVLILNVVMKNLEHKKIERNTLSIIRSAALLPVIILLWITMYQANPGANPMLAFYLPLLSVSFLLVMIIIKTLKLIIR